MARTRSLRTQWARHRVDHGTICGRSYANSGHHKPLCACVDNTFINPNSSGRRPENLEFAPRPGNHSSARSWTATSQDMEGCTRRHRASRCADCLNDGRSDFGRVLREKRPGWRSKQCEFGLATFLMLYAPELHGSGGLRSDDELELG
jgi:hypothetical protein